MNIYGDRGNFRTLVKRAQWRGIDVRVETVGRGPVADLEAFDLIFWGGGPDRDQELVFNDAAEFKPAPVRRAVPAGGLALAVCAGSRSLGPPYATAGRPPLTGPTPRAPGPRPRRSCPRAGPGSQLPARSGRLRPADPSTTARALRRCR